MAASTEIRVTNLDQATNTIEFELTNCTTAFANAIRRVMIAEVPTMAFEHIHFIQNTSPLPDEFIAHRLGLLPLYSEDADIFVKSDECHCSGGCPKCQVMYKLDVTCPQNVNARLVTTDDLEFFDHVDTNQYDAAKLQNCKKFLDTAPLIKPVKPSAVLGDSPVPITIAKLGKGQRLTLIAIAEKNVSRVHSKWSPCCCSAYHMEPVITLNEEFFKSKPPEWKDDFVKKCPQNVFKHGINEESIEIENSSRCTFCRQCQEALEDDKEDENIIIDNVPDKYLFIVQSTGALRPQTIVKKSFAILKAKLENLYRGIENINNLQ